MMTMKVDSTLNLVVLVRCLTPFAWSDVHKKLVLAIMHQLCTSWHAPLQNQWVCFTPARKRLLCL